MAKLVTTDITDFRNQSVTANTINNNFDAIETAVENTLSRDGTSPNQMGADLDMNSNDILNVGNIDAATSEFGEITLGTTTINDFTGLQSFVWRGNYDNGVAYNYNDVVFDQDGSWIAITVTTGNPPPTLPIEFNTYWELMTAPGAGATGPQGPAGTNGTNGTNGTDGADGVVQSIVAGTNITVDATDPANPIVSSSGSAGLVDADYGDITVSGSGTVMTIDNGAITGPELGADVAVPTIMTFPTAGLHILDTDQSHDFIISPGSNLTADRTLTITAGDTDRTLTISGNTAVNQNVRTTDSPVFANPTVTTLELGAAATDTTFSRVSAGVAAIEGNNILTANNIGVLVQAYDADLTAWAAVNPSSYSTTAVIAAGYQPLDADLTSWAGVTRAAGFDTFAATPSSANLRSLLTDEVGTGAFYTVGGALGTPASATLTNASGLPLSGLVNDTTTAVGVGSINLGHASDTTLARVSAGVMSIEGVTVLTTATGQPLDSDLTTIAGLTATTDNFIQSKSSAWASRTPTQVTADLIAFVGDAGSGGTKGLVPAPITGDASKYLKGDGTWGSPAGAGTVTNTGGNLTANSVVLGAGSADTKVVAGVTTDGTSKLTLGVAGSSVGSVDFKNATSGTITVAPTTGALGTVTLTLQAVTGTVYSSGGTDVAVADGGTGLSTLTANNVILGNGTSTPLFVAPSTSGNVLTSNGTTWQSTAPAASGGMTSLGSTSSPSGGNLTLSGLTLTNYKFVDVFFSGISTSNTGGATITMNGVQLGSTSANAGTVSGWAHIDLSNGWVSMNEIGSSASVGAAFQTGSTLTTSSTSITINVSSGNIDGSSAMKVYGVA